VKQPEKYVQIAQQHFSKVAQGYILSDISLPHITICQYWGKETSLLPIINTLKKLKRLQKFILQVAGRSQIYISSVETTK
jgi:hypothetical protein